MHNFEYFYKTWKQKLYMYLIHRYSRTMFHDNEKQLSIAFEREAISMSFYFLSDNKSEERKLEKVKTNNKSKFGNKLGSSVLSVKSAPQRILYCALGQINF